MAADKATGNPERAILLTLKDDAIVAADVPCYERAIAKTMAGKRKTASVKPPCGEWAAKGTRVRLIRSLGRFVEVEVRSSPGFRGVVRAGDLSPALEHGTSR
jgi:hypothetical protein